MTQDWQAESAARKAAIAATLAELKLTVEAQFVPFSQSRNKDEKRKSLNWRVTVKRDGRNVLSTDYSAGIAHCPGYNATKAPATFQPHGYKTHDGQPYAGTKSAFRSAKPHEILSQYKEAIAAAECESGFPMAIDQWGRGPENVFKPIPKSAPIMPDAIDVLYSLTMDSSVLEYATFEDWASEYGYDADSRSAESTYRACLEIALKLRAAIGDAGLETLRNAFQDY